MRHTTPYASIPMLPGPSSVYPCALEAMFKDYPSGFSDVHFSSLYHESKELLKESLQTQNDIAIMTGEPILGLWAGLKSCLKAGDKVLSIGTGFFGHGLGLMAKTLGCDVTILDFPADQTIDQADYLQQIEDCIIQIQPKMLTVVHCETPSASLNPLQALGEIKKRNKVPLLLVDAVSSAGGVIIETDEWGIDILIAGSQKCYSAPPSLTIVALSALAWEVIQEVSYQGYEALAPFYALKSMQDYPYTPYWHGVAALHACLQHIKKEGFAAVYTRHQSVAQYCRTALKEIGIRLFLQDGSGFSPTVTGAYLPEGISWEEFNKRAVKRGLVCAGTVGPYEGKIFRLGHMGSQADMQLVQQAIQVIGEITSPL